MSQKPDESASLVEGRKLGPYELLRRIGAGGMGVVFQARDTERNTLVALKTLHKLEPLTLLKLKNEFRGVVNILHPNLVTLHELMQEEEVWFFTMEYVEGESLFSLFKRARSGTGPSALAGSSRKSGVTPSPLFSEDTVTVARESDPRSSPPVSDATVTSEQGAEAVVVVLQSPAGKTGPLLGLDELRRLLGELALGIRALHQAGKLHCDIKPGNVMVSAEGRVVLLDFGLLTERAGTSRQNDVVFAGTPAYASPEQVLGLPATEASDWYALGVILYEALSGERPFPWDSQLRDKVQREAPPLPESPLIPEDLRELCMALLRRSPAERPDGDEVVRRLRGGEGGSSTASSPAREPALVGRDAHRTALLEAYQSTRGGRGVVVHVHGRSGMGKTALLRRFLADLQRREGAVILRGRCYERESVPFKAVDELIDSLTRYLRGFPPGELGELLPANLSELARAFPVLRQLRPLSQVPLGPEGDPSELRRRAFLAFKELLARLARQVPLVLYLDDLQWGDADSFALLNELISPPDAPPLLLVCSFRSEEAAASALLAEHHRLRNLLGEQLDIRELEVGPLAEAEAARLAASLLGAPGDPRALEIARESEGNPFFVEELTRYTLSSVSEQSATRTAVTLEQAILTRVGQLPDPARDLLEVVAVAGRRIAQGLAARAAEVGSNIHTLWNLLRTGSLVQTRGAREADAVECYHDRIRESVHSSLPPERLKTYHQKLAELLESIGSGQSEELARHYLGAGEREKAARHLTDAAERAVLALAFEHAAELYQYAIECSPEDHSLKAKRASALGSAGRCAEAAPLFLDAARGAPPEEVFRLELSACEQLLASGHLDEGCSLLRPLLKQVGMKCPASPKSALLGLVGRSLYLGIRGTGFRERPESGIPPELLRAIDLTWVAGKGLGPNDMMRGAYFLVRSAQLALEAGEPRRVVRGLADLGVGQAARGSAADARKGREIIEQSAQLAQRLGDPRLLASSRLALGACHAMGGEWRASLTATDEGLRLLEEGCTGVGWDTSFGRAISASALWYLGELGELSTRAVRWMSQADELGDLYGGLWLRLYYAPTLMAAGEPEESEALIRDTLARVGRHTQAFTPQHLSGIYLECETYLYRGEPEVVLERLDGIWKAAKDSFSLASPLTRVFGLYLRAMATLALIPVRPERREALLAQAEKYAVELRREKRGFSRGPEALVRAGIAHVRGQRSLALSSLDDAIMGYEEGEMALRAACARRRKGELLGGDEGRALIEAADAVLRKQGIRDVERWTRAYAAAFSSPGS